MSTNGSNTLDKIAMVDEIFAGYDPAELEVNAEAEHDVLRTRAVWYVQNQNESAASAARMKFYSALASIPSEQRQA